jgi:transcription initiation factor TFIIIB Brf1 subunit/transcription initiation factor TFIIB
MIDSGICPHKHLVNSSVYVVCTGCGLVLDEDQIPSGWEDCAHKHDQITVTSTMERQCRAIGHAFSACDTVIKTAGEMATVCGFRPSNQSGLVACFYLAFRHHQLDRFESEIQRSNMCPPHLLSKYIKIARRKLAGDARFQSSQDTYARRIIPRLALECTSSVSDGAKLAERVQEQYDLLYPTMRDDMTVPGIVKLAFSRVGFKLSE